MAGFLSRGFPQCAGAIDGTHIPVEAPAENASDYYNRKGWHSVILQGTVDHEGLFTDIYTGCQAVSTMHVYLATLGCTAKLRVEACCQIVHSLSVASLFPAFWLVTPPTLYDRG